MAETYGELDLFVNVREVLDVIDRLKFGGKFYELGGLSPLPICFTEARFELDDVAKADSGRETSARATTSMGDAGAAGDQVCSSDKVNTRSSQFKAAFKRLNETLTEENLKALQKIGEMKLSEDEILVGVGVHLIKSLTGRAETSVRRSQLPCPCGCLATLDSSETMYIGTEDTLHGELDIMSVGVGLTATNKIPIPEKDTETSDDETNGAPKAKMLKRSSNEHRVNLEYKKVIDDTAGKQQVTSQAITFGWTQYNRHKDLSPYIPYLYIDGSEFCLFMYNSEKDSLFVTEYPVLFSVDCKGVSLIEKYSGIVAVWLILYHRLFFKKNVAYDTYDCKFKKQVKIESYNKLKDYSVCVKKQMKSVNWAPPDAAIWAKAPKW